MFPSVPATKLTRISSTVCAVILPQIQRVVGDSCSLHIVIPSLLHFHSISAEYIKKIGFFSLQLRVICINSLTIPVFLDLLSESCWLCASPPKRICVPITMMESQSFLAQQCFTSFTFMFFSPSLQRNHLPLAQRRVPS